MSSRGLIERLEAVKDELGDAKADAWPSSSQARPI